MSVPFSPPARAASSAPAQPQRRQPRHRSTTAPLTRAFAVPLDDAQVVLAGHRPAAKVGQRRPPGRWRPVVVALACAWASVALFVPVTPVQAQVSAASVSFDVPAAPLDVALGDFGQQAGLIVVVDASLTAGLRSPGVQGRLSVEAGWQQLLQGTGLRAVRNANQEYSLQPLAAPATADAPLLAPVMVTAETPSGYGPGLVQAGSKMPMTAREVPQSVTVLTRQRLDDQGIADIADAMAQAAGVSLYTSTSVSKNFTSRGFLVTNIQIDGGASVTKGAYYTTLPDLAVFEQLEVLRGADGLFNGAGEPGGGINLVRKRPTATPQLTLTASAGSWNHYRVMLDASRALNEDGTVRARLVAVREDRDYFYDVAHSDKRILYGVVEADLSPGTTVSLGASDDHRHASYWRSGLPRYSTGADIDLPRDTYLATDWSRWDTRTTDVFATVRHAFNTDWRVVLNLNYSRQQGWRRELGASGAVTPGTSTGPVLSAIATDVTNAQRSADVALTGRFDWLGRSHDVVAGANWQEVRTHALGQTNATFVPPGLDRAVDVLRFDPWGYAEPAFVPDNATPSDRVRQYGLYAALRLRATDRLGVIGGVRYSQYRNDTVSETLNSAGAVTRRTESFYKDDHIVTPYGALTYDITADSTVYASVAETYVSQANRLTGPEPGGAPLDPITGRSYEIGVKSEWLAGRLNTAAALYRIDRNGQGVREFVGSTDGAGRTCCWVGEGQVRSQGVDLEVNGTLLPGWEVYAGYTYNHNRDRYSQDIYDSRTPSHLFKLWTSVALSGRLTGLTLGGGVNLQSSNFRSGTVRALDAQGNVTNQTVPFSFTQPGYAVWNAFASYRFNPTWSARFNLNNVFDKRYYQTIGNTSGSNWYGEPRNVMLTVQAQF